MASGSRGASSGELPEGDGAARPGSRPALARVSAHDFPNLSRASQLSQDSAKRAAASGLRRSSVVKAQQEMSRRAEGPVDVGVTLTIVDESTGTGVPYKNDGARFPTSKYTLKLVQVRVGLLRCV